MTQLQRGTSHFWAYNEIQGPYFSSLSYTSTTKIQIQTMIQKRQQYFLLLQMGRHTIITMTSWPQAFPTSFSVTNFFTPWSEATMLPNVPSARSSHESSIPPLRSNSDSPELSFESTSMECTCSFPRQRCPGSQV